MGVRRFNREGYFDPVPHEALSNIEKEARAWKPLVYVASPFARDEAGNTENAIRYCRFAVDSHLRANGLPDMLPVQMVILLPGWIKQKKNSALIFNRF